MSRTADQWKHAISGSFSAPLPVLNNMVNHIDEEKERLLRERAGKVAQCHREIGGSEASIKSLRDAVQQTEEHIARLNEDISQADEDMFEAGERQKFIAVKLEENRQECEAAIVALTERKRLLGQAVRVVHMASSMLTEMQLKNGGQGGKNQEAKAFLQGRVAGVGAQGREITREEFLGDALEAVKLALAEGSDSVDEVETAKAALAQITQPKWVPRPMQSLTDGSMALQQEFGKVLLKAERKLLDVSQKLGEKVRSCDVEKAKLGTEQEQLEKRTHELKVAKKDNQKDLISFQELLKKQLGALESSEVVLKELNKDCEYWLDDQLFEKKVEALEQQLGALNECKKSLGGKDAAAATTSFIQKRSVNVGPTDATNLNLEDSSESMARSKASFEVEEVARKTKSFALFQAANAIKSTGSFEKVIGMIEKLISHLSEQIAESETMATRCESSLKHGREEVADAQTRANALKDRLKKKELEKFRLEGETADLVAASEEADSALADYTKDYQESLRIMGELENVNEASVKVLEGCTTLLKEEQVKAHTDLLKAQYNTVLKMIENQVAGIMSLQGGLQADTNILKSQYPGKLQNLQKVTSEARAAMNANTAMIAGLTQQVMQDKEDSEAAKEQVKAANEALDKWLKYCAPLNISHADMMKNRREEIQALQNAKSILSNGDVSPGATSFLQRNKKFLQRPESFA